jgi:hypothetical protein
VSTRSPRRPASRPRQPAKRPARARRQAPSERGQALGAARRTLARVPLAGWVCALVALLNAACWSVITPPFLALDEPDHFAYVQQLAEARALPSSSQSAYSPEERLALRDLHQPEVRFRPAGHPIFAAAEQEKLRGDLAQPLSRLGSGGVGVAATEPPLYYALAAVPYALGSSGSVLDRLELIRLLSAALAGVSALFVFLFLREALPGARWAWTVGGLGAALAALLGFASSTVNPDALLFALSAALLYCLARGFRRGLTRGGVFAIGALIAAGLMTKLNFIGLAPGAILGLILLARREARTAGRRVYHRLLAPALMVAVSPGMIYGLVNALSNHRTFGAASSGLAALTGAHGSLWSELSYIWQFYLPRLPGMHNDFGEIFTTRQIWFRNFVGLYGWGDTPFPGWVYDAALIPAALLAGLFIRALALGRSALRGRAAELATYAAMAAGLMLLVAASGYLAFPGSAVEFTDARYALPLLALWGAVLALTARGAGRRWGPAVGALIVVLILAHDIFGQLQVIARYYG